MKKSLLIALALLLYLPSVAQTVPVSGSVMSAEDGQPLPGVTVTISGTTKGAITGNDGSFSLTGQSGQVLVFSYLGYREKRVAIEGRESISVVMEYDTTQLEELVVVGYGTMKKSDLTGAVASVKGDVLEKAAVATVNEALQGRLAGVTVTSDTGQPGSGATIRIRGIGSVNSGVDPLYVVDGMIVSDISFLSPNDIASTEVLKDASSASIYGSRAANGVVLITTKTGVRGDRMNISFDAYAGVQNRWNKLDLMGRDEFMKTYLSLNAGPAEKEQYVTGGLNNWLNKNRIGPSNQYLPIAGDGTGGTFDYGAQDTDWQDAVFRKNAVIQNYHLSIDGGSEKVSYAISANYFSQDGTIIGSEYERVNMRLNTSYQVREWLKVGQTLNFSTVKSKWAMNNNSSPGASVLSAALAMAPWDPTHYPAGTANYLGDDLGGRISAASNFKNVINPFSMEKNFTNNKDNDQRWLGSVYIDITPLKGLTYHSDINFDFRYNRDRGFTNAFAYSSYDKRDHNSIGQGMYYGSGLMLNNYATYARSIGKHDFSIMAGVVTEMSKNESVSAGGSDLLNTSERFWSVRYATDNFTQGGSYNGEFRRMSVISRLHYSYDNRYLLTASFRADANREFTSQLWGYFPSAAVAWKISEESWMKEVRDISQLKLRFGWGLLGNDAVPTNVFTQEMFSGTNMFVGYPLGPGTGDIQTIPAGAAIISQKNLSGKWEETQHWNAAVDFGFWQNRLSGSVDLFIRDTRQLLLSRRWPYYAGVLYSAIDNIGTMRNKGIEFTIEHQNNVRTRTGPLFYSISGNMSFIKNEVVDMKGADPVYGDKAITNQGMSVHSFWGYRYQGVFYSEEQIKQHFDIWDASSGKTAEEIAEHNKGRNGQGYTVGDAIYADTDGNGNIDSNDMVVIGNPFPKFTYGLNMTLDWKGFDLQMFFQGVYGNQIYNAVRIRTEARGTESQLSTAMRDVWSNDNPNGTIPNPANSRNYSNSDRFIENGSYLRLKNLQLGYSLPLKATEKMRIQKLRVYLSASNLFTVTNYTGYDPEVGGGVDYGNYPQSRVYMLGLNVNF